LLRVRTAARRFISAERSSAVIVSQREASRMRGARLLCLRAVTFPSFAAELPKVFARGFGYPRLFDDLRPGSVRATMEQRLVIDGGSASVGSPAAQDDRELPSLVRRAESSDVAERAD
jgi:hypothetical protein